jgi:hypothetical protein
MLYRRDRARQLKGGQMSCYIISYDLKEAGEDYYESLIAAIKAYKTWAHITESTWAVVTDENQKLIRDSLARLVPEGSRLFVIKSGTAAAWKNVMCRNQWLKDNL